MTDIGDGHETHTLTRFGDVIEVLGGVNKVAALTKRSRGSVWNWRQAGQFPPDVYRVIDAALARRDLRADMRLFAFDTCKGMRRVDVAVA